MKMFDVFIALLSCYLRGSFTPTTFTSLNCLRSVNAHRALRHSFDWIKRVTDDIRQQISNVLHRPFHVMFVLCLKSAFFNVSNFFFYSVDFFRKFSSRSVDWKNSFMKHLPVVFAEYEKLFGNAVKPVNERVKRFSFLKRISFENT